MNLNYQYKNDVKFFQQTVIKLQKELISKQTCASAETVDSKANREQFEDSERRKQVVLFGVPEECDLGSTVNGVLRSACGQREPTLTPCWTQLDTCTVRNFNSYLAHIDIAPLKPS